MFRELQLGDPQVIGPYRLRGQLGVGGMGRVFLGVSETGRPGAVKVVRPDLAADPEFRTRFRREITVARRVSSQFTAPVIDADVDGPAPWLATAFVAGPSLADAVSENGPFRVRSLLELAAGLAEALRAIHAAGVVHRDLKPTNVLLSPDGPRVIDFGISRAIEASALTHTGMVVGSPGFMSPEQAEGLQVGPPTDVFSLGAILAYAATGEGPFGTGSTPALVYRVVHSQASVDRVPAEVRPLVERCLAKDPSERPTARELLAYMSAVEPVEGWLPQPLTRTSLASSANVPPPIGPASGGPGRRYRPPHRFPRRPLAIAAIIVGLLTASAAGGMALAASLRQSPGPPTVQRSTSVQAPTSPATYAPPTPGGQGASQPAAAPSTIAPSTSSNPATGGNGY